MRLVYTGSARGRLRSILSHIRRNGSEERAEKFRKAILDRAEELLEQPLKGHPLQRLEFLKAGHRGLSYGRHLIIYHVTEGTIFITDFFDTKQHPSHMRG